MVTRLGLYGGPRPPYGSFAGKVEAEVVEPEPEEQTATGGYVYERPTGVPRRDDDMDLFRTIHAFIQVVNKL